MTTTTPTTAKDIAFTAYHESGHAIATVLSGGRVHFAQLTDTDPTTLGVCSSSDHHERYDPMIAFAGPFIEAVARYGHEGRAAVKQSDVRRVLAASGRRDQEIIDLAKMRDAGYSDDHREIEKHLSTCWAAVSALAEKIIAGPITHSDVTNALGLSSDPDVAAHQLHLIKQGHKPGTFSVTKNGETLSVTSGLH